MPSSRSAGCGCRAFRRRSAGGAAHPYAHGPYRAGALFQSAEKAVLGFGRASAAILLLCNSLFLQVRDARPAGKKTAQNLEYIVCRDGAFEPPPEHNRKERFI